MNSSFRFLFAATVAVAVAAPAHAANYNLVPSSTGNSDYTYDIHDKATAKGIFADTFSFTIPGITDGFVDLGVINVANPVSNNNIDFVSAYLSGTPSNVILTVLNAGSLSTAYNDNEIAVVAGLTYVLHVSYKAAAKNAIFNGNVAFSPTAAPEAATWAMMLLGFGMIGAGLRRGIRSKRNIAVSYA